MDFPIRSYAGAGRIDLGMTAEDVAIILGPPADRRRSWKGTIEEFREGLQLSFDEAGRVTEIVLHAPSSALLNGVDLLRLSDPVQELVKSDSSPYEFVGTVVSLALGIALAGFDYEGARDRSVTVFSKGRWDSLKDRLSPLHRPDE